MFGEPLGFPLPAQLSRQWGPRLDLDHRRGRRELIIRPEQSAENHEKFSQVRRYSGDVMGKPMPDGKPCLMG